MFSLCFFLSVLSNLVKFFHKVWGQPCCFHITYFGKFWREPCCLEQSCLRREGFFTSFGRTSTKLSKFCGEVLFSKIFVSIIYIICQNTFLKSLDSAKFFIVFLKDFWKKTKIWLRLFLLLFFVLHLLILSFSL